MDYEDCIADRAVVPNEKLMPWNSAVNWGIGLVKRQLSDAQQFNLSTAYLERQLAELQDLEMFLAMHWRDWMDRLSGESHPVSHETLEELMKEAE
jgi:hypothetical protein